jgi:osmotically-inducible protein OsmY
MYRSENRQQGANRTSALAREREEAERGGGEMSRSRGNWTGYVIPYRYYGQGYAGVGYYSVMYQGTGEDEPQGEFDQRNVDYGQGQGTGAAWTGRSGQWSGSGGSQGGYGGGFAGRGPKGYKRSDQRLEEEINDRLMADDRLDAYDVQVKVKDGEVTLSGTVPDRQSKRRAEDIADQVMGVRDVMNQIRVQSESQTGQRDPSSTSTGSRSSTNARSSSAEGSSRNGGRSGDQQSATGNRSRSSGSSSATGTR